MSATELSCQELVELVTEFLEGALPSAERARFEAHLAVCRGCRAYLDQMRQTIRLTGALTEESIPPDVMNALLHAFRNWKGERAESSER